MFSTWYAFYHWYKGIGVRQNTPSTFTTAKVGFLDVLGQNNRGLNPNFPLLIHGCGVWFDDGNLDGWEPIYHGVYAGHRPSEQSATHCLPKIVPKLCFSSGNN